MRDCENMGIGTENSGVEQSGIWIMRRFAGFARFIRWGRQRGGPVDLNRLRARYAADILRSTGVENPRVEAAFAAVPREEFLTPPPWRIFLPGGVIEKNTSDPS